MTKELYEIISRLKQCLLFDLDIKLANKEIKLLMKYINDLEKEIAGEIDE